MRYHVKVAAKKKIISTTAIVAGVLMFSSSVDAQTAPHTNSWDYDTVVGGNVGKDTSVAGVTDITVTGGNGYVAGNADIYNGHTVNVTGDTAGSTFTYSDNRDNITSVLGGNLNSNMNIVIIDRDGLFFTNGSVIDVNGLIAAAGDVGKNDLMNGDDVLKIKNMNPNSMIINDGKIAAKDFAVLAGGNVWNTGTIVTEAGGQILLAAAEQLEIDPDPIGSDRLKIDTLENGVVINTGTMDAGNGGLAAIVSPFAINDGIIRAKAGTVAIAAGETVTLDMYGDGLVELAVDGELADALITNRGTIAAKGGVVNITAKAAKNTVDNLINNEGIITASSATVSGGKIILGGGDSGTIRNAGEIETNAGGSVDVNGERFLQETMSPAPVPPPIPLPLVRAKINSGGADVNIETSGDVVLRKGYINADGGNITITNGGLFKSRVNTVRTQGTGAITLNQNAGGRIQSAIDAISNRGTGTNTVNVGAGSYNEAVVANVDNLNLKGANAGRNGAGIRGAESIIIPNSPGVHVTSDNVTVDGFKIVGGDDGIYVENANNASIINNIVEGSSDNGIEVDGGSNITVEQNAVIGSANNGIKFADTAGANINLNFVAFSVDDGIDIDESSDVDIQNNIVGLSFDDGIDVNESDNVSVGSNLVIGAVDNGIEVSESDGTEISGNTIRQVDNNGISVDGSDELNINGNIVTLTGGNGITVSNGSDIFIRGNQISETGDDGIDLNYVEFADVVENEVSNAGDDGIDVDYSDDILIAENDVTGSNEDGVSINGSGEIFIYNNAISQSGEDGINVENTGYVDIHENTITESEDDGVDVYATSYSIVANNEISDSGDDGVHIAGNGFYPIFFSDERSVARVAFYESSAVIDGNTIENSGGDGVQVDNLLEATIIENIVNESAEHGLYVSGVSNGYVQVQGNEFNDNGDENFAQARFESGDIDLSDLTNPNIFTKTTAGTGVAMQFDDISGGFSSPSDSFERALIIPFGTGLRIVDETLGSTEFTGYTGAGNFYVRLEDGTLLDPLTSDPIVIDGTNASFDGIIPASFAGTALPLATLQFIEDRLYDADDASVNGRGQIFTGFVETIDGPANFQDFLPFFNNTAPLSNFASVTINGLPSIGNFGGGAGALNNIAPAAGEQNDEQELADIEPSAGGNGAEVTCIEDAVNGLGSGSVTYNFGGSFEDTIAGAVGCQSGEI